MTTTVLGGALDSRRRGEALDDLQSERYDLVVIGGGVTGCGAALDGAARGLKVALLEQRDIASGTSSRSSKLVHGGLRYLEQYDTKLVREALRERDLLTAFLAPHLVRPVRFLYPLERAVAGRAYMGAGLLLYDLLQGRHDPLPRHRHLSVPKARQMAPCLRPEMLAGAMVYYDAQVDDARLSVTLARTASVHGATVACRIRVARLVREQGRVVAAEVVDEETGANLVVRGQVFAGCTGVWADELHRASELQAGYQVRMSKGVHLVLPGDAIDCATAVILRTERSVLFVIPWGGRWIVGTTDTEWSGPREEPPVTEDDVDYLLEHLNVALTRTRPVSRKDVISTYAGLRPLVATDESSPTTRLSREHVVDSPVPGLVSVAGGKLTTYRVMAKDVVDAAFRQLPLPFRPSVTAELPLVGADGWSALANETGRIATSYGVDSSVVSHLAGRYGTRLFEVLDLVRHERQLCLPVVEGHPYLRAEVVHAVICEGALHVEDVLSRRARLALEAPDAALGAAAAVSELMAGVLGWSEEQREAELTRYEASVRSQPAV